LDQGRPVEFSYIPRHDELLREIKDTELIRRLIWFSDGYYAVRQQGDQVYFDVLKFGRFPFEPGEEQAAFSFGIQRGASGRVMVTHVARRRNVDFGRLMTTLWRRIRGTI
jgi:hypothetical protein